MTMSRILAACLAVSLSCAALAGVPQPPAVTARAWLLMDATSGQPIAGGNPEERIEPASLTKLMTAYVVFGALKGRSLAPGQAVPVSERACRADEPRGAAPGDEKHELHELDGLARPRALLHGERPRAARRRADPRLPRALQAVLGTRIPLQRHHAAKPHRAPVARSDGDGVKTGHTESAGYCLIASAKRGARRLVSVVIGSPSERLRARESQKLLNFGFQSYDGVRLYQKGQAISKIGRA